MNSIPEVTNLKVAYAGSANVAKNHIALHGEREATILDAL